MTWRIVKLGELVDFRTGKLDSNAAVVNGRYPFFTCSQETLRTNSFSFDTECVLLAGNNANGVFSLKYFRGKFDAYQRTYIVTTRTQSQLITQFLYYALRPKLSELRNISTGAATKFLTLTILNNTEIQIPPLPIQKRIAGILSAYDELIENSQRRIKMLESMARGLYREWFVHFRFPGHENHPKVPSPLGDIPKGWEVKKLSDTCECIVDSEHKTAPTEVVGFPMIRTPNIGKGYLLLDDARCVSEEIYAAWTRRAVPKEGDLILAREAPVGNVGIVGKGAVVCLGQRTVLIRANSKIIDTHILLRILLGDYCQNAFLGAASGATVSHLNLADIRNMSIPCPPIDIQSQMCPVFRAIDHNIGYLLRKNQNLRRTRDLLLPRLLSGQIDLKVD